MCLKWLSRQECWGTWPTLKEDLQIHKKQLPHRGEGKKRRAASSFHTRTSQREEDERVTEMKYLWCNSWHCGLLLLQRPFSQRAQQQSEVEVGRGGGGGYSDRQSIDGWYTVKHGKRVWKVMSSGKHVERLGACPLRQPAVCHSLGQVPFSDRFRLVTWRRSSPSTNDSVK